MPELAARANAFLDRVVLARATSVSPVEGGVLTRSTEHAACFCANVLLLHEPKDAASVAALAERSFAGLPYRHIEVSDEVSGASLVPGLAAHGYRHAPVVVLAAPCRTPAPQAAVSPIDFESLRSVVELEGHAIHGLDVEVARQLASVRARLGFALAAQWLAVRDGAGRVLAHADLYRLDGVAQVEELATAPAVRGRGLASALVHEAIRRARAAGDDLVLLVCDDEERPLAHYRRLGFVELARRHVFVRELAVSEVNAA